MYKMFDTKQCMFGRIYNCHDNDDESNVIKYGSADKTRQDNFISRGLHSTVCTDKRVALKFSK